MNVLYHLTDAPPRIPGTDAVYQDVAALERRFRGGRVQLYPFRQHGIDLQPKYFGIHALPRLLWLDRRVQVHHVFGGGVKHYPILQVLKRPVVYSAVAGMQDMPAPPARVQRVVQTVIVASERNRKTLENWGFRSVAVIRPGIDVSGFHHHPLPFRSEFVLLAGSAPWVADHFAMKGFDALFAVAARRPEVRLLLLWRGLLEEELSCRLQAFGLEKRVEVVRGWADVNALLGHAHAAVVLADRPSLIKEYPHSLIESLVAGKPVLVSQCIAMADYVRGQDCGHVVPELTEPAVEAAVDSLMDGYDAFQQRALEVGRRDFSLEKMLEQHQRVYESCGYRSDDARGLTVA